MLFFIGMDIPQKGILYTPVRPARSTPKNAQNSQNLSKRGQNRPNFCIFVAKKIAKTLLYGFVKIYTWICKILYLVKVVWYIFGPLPNKKQAEVRPRFQSLLKLLLWTKGVEWVKVLGSWALGLLCLLQWFWYCSNKQWTTMLF